jgi:hypothetical protein
VSTESKSFESSSLTQAQWNQTSQLPAMLSRCPTSVMQEEYCSHWTQRSSSSSVGLRFEGGASTRHGLQGHTFCWDASALASSSADVLRLRVDIWLRRALKRVCMRSDTRRQYGA